MLRTSATRDEEDRSGPGVYLPRMISLQYQKHILFQAIS